MVWALTMFRTILLLNELPNLPLILNLFLHAGYSRTVRMGKFSNLVTCFRVVFVPSNPFWEMADTQIDKN
jgi:hypothetical protein